MENGFRVGENSLSSLFWDLVLFAKIKDELDAFLKTPEPYCNEIKIAVNTKKIKCMIFNQGGRLMKRFFYLDFQFENVRFYKCLEFTITPSGEINSGSSRLS